MEKRECSCTVGGNVIDTSTMEDGDSLKKKLGIKPPYDPAIPLLGLYLRKPKLKETYISHVSHGEGNGTLFQYSHLENPMDRGAW